MLGELKRGYDMPKRPTRDPHSGFVNNPKTFQQAYEEITNNPGRTYRTDAGTLFECEARITSKGPHEGEKLIIFKQAGIEMARAYECCWGKQTNCNRTYIDSYSREI